MSAQSHQDVLVGREAELHTLEGVLQASLDGRGGLVVVGGEAGIGKTALVQRIAASAGDRGALVLTSYCYDLEVTPPYGPWLDLSRNFPELGDSSSPFSTGSNESTAATGSAAALYEAVWSRFAQLAGDRPVVLILEDIHWADQASLDLLRAMSRRLGDLPVLCIATFRDLELSPGQPLYRMLHPIVRESRAVRISLRQLRPDAVQQLVQARYGLARSHQRRLVDYLMRFAEGSPFFTEELLSALEDDGVLTADSGSWSLGDLARFRVPPLLRQVLSDRFERLDSTAHGLLQIASVIGGEVPLDIWQAVTEATDDTLAQTIEQALDARVLVEVPNRPALRFRHALIREVLYEQLVLPRRGGWHRAVADVLVCRPAPDPDAVAYHYDRANESELAAEWLIRAGRRAGRTFAYQITIERFEQALEILSHTDQESDRAWLLAELTEAYRYSDPRRAIRYADAALAFARQTGDKALEAVILRSRAHIRGFLQEDALEEVEQSQTLFEALSPHDHDQVLHSPLGYTFSTGTYAQRIGFYGLYSKALSIASDYLERAATPTTPAEQQEHAIAYRGVALGAAGLGKVDQAREAFGRSRDLFTQAGNFIGAANSVEYEYTMVLQVYLPHLVAERRQSIDDVDRLFGQSTLVDPLTGQNSARLMKALLFDGRWDDARAAALAMSSVDAVQVDCLAILAELDWLQGQPERAMSHIARVLPDGAAAEPGSVFYERLLSFPRVAAEIEIERGNHDASRAWIDSLERRLASSDITCGHAEPHILWARYFNSLGDLETARSHALQAIERASIPSQPVALFEAHLTLGAIDTANARFEDAGRHLGKALELAEAFEAPFEIARARLELAELALASGSKTDALLLIEQVQDTATTLAAQPLLQRATELRDRADMTSDERPELPSGLSSREVEVLRLVAQGMTDSEVAEQLFISPRTVSGHLQSIYNKLGVSSRVAATGFAFKHELV